MSQFVVAVRSYQRADLFATRTLRVLHRHGLTDRTTLFVGSDPEPYRKHCTLPIIPVPVGGANAIRSICDYYARGTPIFFMDDDLGDFYRFDLSAGVFVDDGLEALIEDGFLTADFFTFAFITNRMWLLQKQKRRYEPRYTVAPGCAFGARNYPELITTPTGHCDDVVRTVNYIRAGLQQYCWLGAGFKISGYGKLPGGLQSSGDRDDMSTTCRSLLPVLGSYARGIEIDHAGMPVVRLLPPATIKRLTRHSRPKLDV